MDVSAKTSRLGFLTIVDEPALGHVGGLLVLDVRARPLEFHCTAPVQPNRAQEILYGPTLRSFLYGEQIATVLLDQCRLKPLLIVTDLAEVTEVRAHVATPVVWIQCANGSTVASEVMRSEQRAGAGAGAEVAAPWRRLRFGRHDVAVPGQYASDELHLQKLNALVEDIDLAEPFERIREAIREAQGAS